MLNPSSSLVWTESVTCEDSLRFFLNPVEELVQNLSCISEQEYVENYDRTLLGIMH